MAIFRPEEEPKVRELLDALERPVELLVALGPEVTPLPGARDVDFGAETERIVRELAALSEHVSFRVEEKLHTGDRPESFTEHQTHSQRHGPAPGEHPAFDRYPAVAVLPEGVDVGLRYYGLPWGYELGSLIGAVLEAGKRGSSLKAESLEALAALDRDLVLDVFVTPT
jgi:alkyl hydroperoxide reductase subunit AhpF